MTNGEKLQSIFPNIIKYGNILIDDTGALQKNILFDDTWWNAEYKEPTIKNDLGVEHHKQNIQAYAHDFGVSEEQAEKELAVKTNLGVDCISRTQAQTEIEMNASRYTIAKERGGMGQVEWSDQLIKVSDAVDIIRQMPSATPQEPTDKLFSKADIDSIIKAVNEGWELRINEVLDKIRAEIEFEVDHRTNMLCAEDILEIIDKYKGESEK